MTVLLKIRKRPIWEWLVFFVILMPFAFGMLIDLLQLPSLVKYTIDVVWLFLLIVEARGRFRMPNRESGYLLGIAAIFLLITLFGFALSLGNPLYYLWGFRNNLRFFVFFFACIIFVPQRNAEGYLKLLDLMFYVNFPVVLLQYFVFGYNQDFLGGIFGVHVGCNDTTIVFFAIVIAKSVLYVLNRKESFWLCLLKLVMALVVATLAEIKFFFILALIIVVFCAMLTDFSMKKVAILLVSVVSVVISANLLELLFPNWENWFSLDYMISAALSSNGYTDSGDMNRLTSIPIAWDMFLTTWPKRLFGLGLGNCDSSTFSFLSTDFFQKYGYLHYNWFSVSFMFLETGILGLTCYLAFFGFVYVLAGKRKKSGEADNISAQLAKVMAVVSVILIIYNQSMRTEGGYMMYFILALPFLRREKETL